MLDRTTIREHADEVQRRLLTKGFELDLQGFQQMDQRERAIRIETEELRALRNRAGDAIAAVRKSGGDASAQIETMKQVSASIKALEEELSDLETRLSDFLAVIPNLPDQSVPVGNDAAGNQVVRVVGTPGKFDFPVKDHVDIGAALGILDPERAAKVAGARFTNYYGSGARLERALINFMLDIHTREHGYTEILPPFMANRKSFFGTGNLPKFEADLFKIEGTDFYLAPTAEVPVTNVFADEILEGSALPVAFAAYTPCFRSEAGSYGKDTRGLIRQHQFNKVELVRFSTEEDSYRQLELLTGHAEEILRRLGLPYRVVTLCSGDMSFSSAKTYDLEVWIPSQNAYREISSCSNFEAFQARRANIRYRPENGKKTRFAHTLNGSGLAIGRTWVAIVENFQQADGTVSIPPPLRPYLGGLDRIKAEERAFSI